MGTKRRGNTDPGHGGCGTPGPGPQGLPWALCFLSGHNMEMGFKVVRTARFFSKAGQVVLEDGTAAIRVARYITQAIAAIGQFQFAIFPRARSPRNYPYFSVPLAK